MDIRDKVIEIVYESKEGLFPLAIAEAVSKRYSIPVNSRQVEDVVRKNPKPSIEPAPGLTARGGIWSIAGNLLMQGLSTLSWG
jgi:hypothetical protein